MSISAAIFSDNSAPAAASSKARWRSLRSAHFLCASAKAAPLLATQVSEMLQLAEGLGYTEGELRWIAQRLRRALDVARASRRVG